MDNGPNTGTIVPIIEIIRPVIDLNKPNGS